MRDEARTAVLAALRGRPPAGRGPAEVFRRHLDMNRGAMVGPPLPHAPQDAEEFARTTYASDFGMASPPDPSTLEYIGEFLREAAERKVPVLLLLPPMHPAIQARFDQTGLDALQTRLARAAAARYPNVVVVDGRRAGYDHTVFCEDKIHLNGRGAFALSADLAPLCGRTLADAPPGAGARPRWFDLPRFRDRPIDVGMEDYEASRIALESSRATRR
jgi:hypothetical protein